MDLLLLGKEPVSAEQPAGTEIRYDPSFDELQTEIDKLSSPSAAGTVDWTKVVKMSSEILSGKSKDLLVASYLALALIYVNQNDGLSTGLRIYLDLLNNFWEDLFPPKTRMRGRIRAIEWWMEKTEAALKQLKQDSFQADQLNAIKEDLEEIDRFFSEHLEEPFSFASIRDFLNSLAVQSEEVPQESKSPLLRNKEEVASPRVAEKVEETKKAEISDDISSQRDAQRALDEGLQKLRKAAAYLWQQDLTNPLVYRFFRISAWSSLDDLPPATNDRTRILSPNTQIRNILYELKNKGDNEALLKSAEERFPQFVFWLDLNRLTSEALNNLGSSYQKAHEVVCQETAFLIQRLPGLEGLCFSDGTPFADPETKQWLKGIVLRPGSSAMDFSIVQEPVTGADDGNLLEKEIGECRILIKKGRLLDAVERLQSKLRNSFSQRDKLLWRIALSQVLMGANQVSLTLPHLEQIIKEIDLYKLEEYDPLIAIKGLKLAWFAFDSRSDQVSKGKAAEALQRIATLDLCEVIRLGKGEVKKNK